VRVLEGVGQHAAAIDEAVSRGYLVISSVFDSSGSQLPEDMSLSQRKKRVEKMKKWKSESGVAVEFGNVGVMGEFARANDVIRSEVTNPVAQWIYTSLLTDIGLHFESTASVDYFLSSSSQCYSSWLSAEKAWALLLIAVKEKRNNISGSVHAGDVLASFGLLRDMELAPEVCNAVITALTSVLAMSAQDSTTVEIEPTVRFRLGVAMWLAGGVLRNDKGKCLATLLGAAKLDPHLGSVYAFIGHYYGVILKDTMRATKCYLKALAYNPMDTEAGVALSHIFIESGDTSAAVKLWNDVTELTAAHASWCFALEGHYHLALEQYDEAVESFRKSLELNEEDADMWFGLGLSYSFLLQNNAALKSLQKAYGLMEARGGNTVYILYVQAEVERRVGLLHAALEHFETVCQSPQSDVVSQKGLADVCLALAYERYSMGWTRGAADCIVNGLRILDQIPGVSTDGTSFSGGESAGDNAHILGSVLKLRGDICCFARHLGPVDFKHQEDAGDMWSYDSISELLQQAEESYQRVLSLYEQGVCSGASTAASGEDLAAAWYDIGCAAYYQAVVLGTSMGQGSGISSSEALIRVQSANHSYSPHDKLQTALGAFLSGIRASEGAVHSGCWNGIGLCIRNNDTLKELCFVLAARIDASPTAYANISLLLILHGLDKQAKECLSALQLMEANPLHWVTLGTLMERELTISASDLSDLQAAVPVYDAYCAAIEVAKPADAWLGLALAWMRVKGLVQPSGELTESFGSLKRRGVTDIDVKYFVEIPVKLFLHRRSVQPYAWSLLGWALGFRGHYEEAIQAYGKALKCLDVTAMYASSTKTSGADAESISYSINAVRAVLTSITKGINQCVSAGRFPGASFHNMLEEEARRILAPDNCKNIHKFLPDATTVIGAAGSVTNDSVESKSLAFCNNGKFSECIDTLFTEIAHQLESSNVAETVRIVEVSLQVLRSQTASLKDLCVRIWDILAIAIQNRDDSSSSRDATALNLVKSSVNTVCDIASHVMDGFDRKASSVRKILDVLEFALDNHPENDKLLRLLSSCDEQSRTQYSLQSLGMTSKDLMATYELDERFDVQQSLLCHVPHDVGTAKPRCRCNEIKLRQGHGLVQAYTDSVNLAVGNAVARGHRCDSETKKHLLRSLMYNPSDMNTWNTLASQIFSDNVLGARPADVDLSSLGGCGEGEGEGSNSGVADGEESKREQQQGREEKIKGRRGCFFGQSHIDLCAKIIAFTHKQSIKNTDVADIPSLSGMCDLVSSMSSEEVHSSNIVHAARRLFEEGRYQECIDRYREGITEAMATPKSDSSKTAHVAQLWNELGCVFSNGLQPEGAEYCFGVACDTWSSDGKGDDVTRGYSRIMSAIAYLHRYHAGNDINDANKAKAICDECTVSTSTGSVQAVGCAVTAAVWVAQGKAKKCAVELEKAKLAWGELEIPKCVHE
jgi:tetratricopeptide (TPR) repeat protein